MICCKKMSKRKRVESQVSTDLEKLETEINNPPAAAGAGQFDFATAGQDFKGLGRRPAAAAANVAGQRTFVGGQQQAPAAKRRKIENDNAKEYQLVAVNRIVPTQDNRVLDFTPIVLRPIDAWILDLAKKLAPRLV